METNGLGTRETPGQRAEARERGSRLVLVEPRDGGGRERLRVVGREARRSSKMRLADSGLPIL